MRVRVFFNSNESKLMKTIDYHISLKYYYQLHNAYWVAHSLHVNFDQFMNSRITKALLWLLLVTGIPYTEESFELLMIRYTLPKSFEKCILIQKNWCACLNRWNPAVWLKWLFHQIRQNFSSNQFRSQSGDHIPKSETFHCTSQYNIKKQNKKISCVGNRLPIFLDVLSTAIYFHSLHQTGVCLSIKTLIKHDNSIAESIKFLTKDK